MENSILIRKVHMNCPLCDKMHEIEERKRTTSITIKGEDFIFVQMRMKMKMNLKQLQ